MTRQIAVFTLLITIAAAVIGYWAWAAHRPGQKHAIDLQELGDFPLAEEDPSTTDESIPKRLRDRDGKPITLSGFVYAPNAASDRISAFQLVHDLRSREHRGPPQALERVFATVSGCRGVEDPGTYTLMAIHGVLHVGIHRDREGRMDSVYRMDVDGVAPVP